MSYVIKYDFREGKWKEGDRRNGRLNYLGCSVKFSYSTELHCSGKSKSSKPLSGGYISFSDTQMKMDLWLNLQVSNSVVNCPLI